MKIWVICGKNKVNLQRLNAHQKILRKSELSAGKKMRTFNATIHVSKFCENLSYLREKQFEPATPQYTAAKSAKICVICG